MKGSLVLALTLLAASGCSKPPGSDLIGVWEASIGDMLTAAEAKGRRVDTGSFEDMSITVEYKADGTFSFTQRTGNLETIETGTWEVSRGEAGGLRIKLTTKIAGRDQTKEGEVIFEDKDSCRVMPVQTGDPALILKRKRDS